MKAAQSILDEHKTAVRSGPRESCISILRSATDLSLQNADRFNLEQITAFVNVLCHVIQRIESLLLFELSEFLSSLETAPLTAVRKLASHDEIETAETILGGLTCCRVRR
jgi:hypothetical protein